MLQSIKHTISCQSSKEKDYYKLFLLYNLSPSYFNVPSEGIFLTNLYKSVNEILDKRKLISEIRLRGWYLKSCFIIFFNLYGSIVSIVVLISSMLKMLHNCLIRMLYQIVITKEPIAILSHFFEI